MKAYVYLLAVGWALVAGCDLLQPSEFEPEIIVSAFLVAGEPLPAIRISYSLPVDAHYNADSAAIRNADLRVQLLASDGSVAHEYAYRYRGENTGRYVLSNRDGSPGKGGETARLDSIVLPLHTYRLIADVPGHPSITSTTTVPDTFSVRTVTEDTVTFQSGEPFTFEVTPPDYPGRQSVFVFNTIALDGFEHQLTPFARSLLEDGGDVTIGDLRERVSPILNEENFEEQPQGTLRIQFPWLGIYFYGRNRVIIQALDDNLYDFMRSRSVQQGGSTRPPGEIPNIIDHVEGGRGLFGSYARAIVDFYVTSNEN